MKCTFSFPELNPELCKECDPVLKELCEVAIEKRLKEEPAKNGVAEKDVTDANVYYKHNMAENISMLNINEIIPDPEQPRKKLNKASLQGLAQSIKEKGLIEPIIVSKDGNRYKIIAGERRWRACKLAKLSKIPCIVKQLKSKDEAKEIQILENLQREDISPIERAKALQEYLASLLNVPKEDVRKVVFNYHSNKCKENEKKAIDKTLKIIGKSARTLDRWLYLLTLPEEIQQKIDSPDSIITVKHIENVMKLKDLELIKKLIQLIEDEKLSTGKTKEIVEKMTKKKSSHFSSLDNIEKSLKHIEKKIGHIEDKKEKDDIKSRLYKLKTLMESLIDKLS